MGSRGGWGAREEGVGMLCDGAIAVVGRGRVAVTVAVRKRGVGVWGCVIGDVWG